MPPPQLPSVHAKPRPPPHDSSVPAAKRAPPTAPALTASAPPKKIARPASRPRPPSTPAKNGAPHAAAAAAAPRQASSAASHDGGRRQASSFMAPRGTQTVRPARRLPPGTAVYVRTTFRPRNRDIRCRILLWLRARVVSSPDAYHCTVKYAADLNDMFAGKIVSKPVDHVRVAPHRTAAKPDPRKMAPPPPEAKVSSLPRR